MIWEVLAACMVSGCTINGGYVGLYAGEERG